jgi:hypothetical protein
MSSFEGLAKMKGNVIANESVVIRGIPGDYFVATPMLYSELRLNLEMTKGG